MREILVIGGSSFVASEALKGLSTSSCKITAPSKGDLDIQNVESIRGYTKDADAVINFVAYTNVKAATTSQSGEAWKLNVEGTANIASVCKSEGKFLIHVSTDGVFPITGDFKGLHSENETINDDPTLVSAYGYTKLMGEREIDRCGTKAAILRIAYPFGNIAFPEKDYVTKLIRSVKLGYALFSDQEFTPTYIRSLPKVIGKLLENELSGVFHWVCRGLTTPYKVGMFINEKLNLGHSIKKGSLVEFEKTNGKQPYARFGGLSTEITEGKLHLVPPTWQEAVSDFIDRSLPELA